MTATRAEVLHSLKLQLQQISRKAAPGGVMLVPSRESAGEGGGDEVGEGVVSMGVAGLDGLLPLRGIPKGGMVEWLIPDVGCGAATLALAGVREALGVHGAEARGEVRGRNGEARPGERFPGVSSASPPASVAPSPRARGYWVVIDLERQFFPPAAWGWGIPPQQLLVVRPTSERDAAWAFEQALRCPGVAVTWNWAGTVTERVLRRWKVAAETGGGLGVLFRPDRALKQAAWADVRWLVQPLASREGAGRRFRLQLVYCRGALGGDRVEVECDDETGLVRVVPQLAHSTSRVTAARA